MKNLKLILCLLTLAVFCAACSKSDVPLFRQKQAEPPAEEVNPVCTNACDEAMEQTPYPECECVKPAPQAFKPGLELQARLIQAVADDDKGFIANQIDQGADINVYMSFELMDGFLSFRETLKSNTFIYDTIKKDTPDLTLLLLAAAMKKDGIVELLLERKADPNMISLGKTPLKIALLNNDTVNTRRLLENNAAPDLMPGADNDLFTALKNKDYETAALIVRYAAENNIAIESALPSISEAVAKNDTKLITFLLDNAKLSPDTVDSSGRPLIATAVIGGDINTVKLILAAAADINNTDNSGVTALMLLANKANTEGDLKLLQFLIDSGADIAIKDKRGETALFYAVKSGRTAAINTLLANGADINTAAINGQTALFIPAVKGNLPLVKLLVEKGALAKVKDNAGKTAAQLAVERGHMAVYDFLQRQKS